MPRGCVFIRHLTKVARLSFFVVVVVISSLYSFLYGFAFTFLNAQTDRRLNKIAIFTCRLIGWKFIQKTNKQKIVSKNSFTKQSAILMLNKMSLYIYTTLYAVLLCSISFMILLTQF